MSNIVLTSDYDKPTDEIIKQILGNATLYFDWLEKITKTKFKKEWKYYNSKTGWIYKIYDSKKSLCWIKILNNSFEAHFAFRYDERELILMERISPKIQEELSFVEKKMEGYLLCLAVSNNYEFEELRLLVEFLIKFR